MPCDMRPQGASEHVPGEAGRNTDIVLEECAISKGTKILIMKKKNQNLLRLLASLSLFGMLDFEFPGNGGSPPLFLICGASKSLH